ncbi:zf-CHY-domain-containing protein [Aspergillus steynii IBT 23096]|uniref:Zf-CHY-domain-containing protein n=1 Tax=Aspergillus steynii IBT 23096 TaxID=1392250 RepID=A0A2I2FTU7_9EURO|nr:zf-CHY-domain-containing protein [Aspergillus steynii IBT 23096]PLB44059.1 zf-CHY-domain-containing protein [Aspergillus steynii IBT 23096]
MSGLISSLLIGPVVRQARRLSHPARPHPPSDHDRVAPSPNTQDGTFSANDCSSNGNGRDIMSDLEDTTRSDIDFPDRCQGRDAGPSASPALDVNTRHHESDYSRTQRSRHGSENTSSPAMAARPGPINRAQSPGLERVVPVPLSSQPPHPHEDPGSEELGGNLDNRFYLYDIGGQSLLPEDDGMGILREKIHAIRDLDCGSAEKARMIHELMTANYNSSQRDDGNPSSQTAPSPSSSRSPERAGTPISRWSRQSFDQLSSTPASTTTSIVPEEVRFNLTEDDLRPTFHPKADPDSLLGDAEEVDSEELEEACLGCQHYKRNVKLQCFSCKKWHTCRFCHDEVEDHHLIRPKTENMLCMLCGHAQPAAQLCQNCGELTAQYYCSTCKLWDNDSSKSIYHCNDCGICRIGQGLGKDFFHCKTCCVCLPISIENTHRCIERSTQCDCPICGDYMFTSPETVVFMRCGHSIHQKCLSEYSKTSYRCPICNKTITNMESTFRNLDRTIHSQPMPAEFKDTRALVYCNDCGVKSVVKYHWLGLRCDMCESYNTAQIKLVQSDSLGPLEQESGIDDANGPRLRSSSQNADDAMVSTLASLRVDTSSVPGTSQHSRLSAPSSAEPNGRFSSYSLTRGRAVSPVISNYFGIPPDRGSERSISTSLFGGPASQDRENPDAGELRFWGKKFKYGYGLLGHEEASNDGASDAESGEDASTSEDSASEDDDERAEDEEDEDEDEGIDIFGHR